MTKRSSSVVSVLQDAAKASKVKVKCSTRVIGLDVNQDGHFTIKCCASGLNMTDSIDSEAFTIICDRVILATGSSRCVQIFIVCSK